MSSTYRTVHAMNTKPPWEKQDWESAARSSVAPPLPRPPRALTIDEARAAFDLIDHLRLIARAARDRAYCEAQVEDRTHSLHVVLDSDHYKTRDQAERLKEQGLL